ncbi:Phytohormone-binding protein CSBP [Linum grandiflorum]
MKEIRSQSKVRVDLDILWKSLTKDLHVVVPKSIPDKVKDIQVLHGDGGVGTILIFNFTPGRDNFTDMAPRYQKEEIVEFDETRHRIGLEVVKGGHRDHGFSFYKTTFQLSGLEQGETVVDVTVTYEYEKEINDSEMSSRTISHTLQFLRSMEAYLLSVQLVPVPN